MAVSPAGAESYDTVPLATRALRALKQHPAESDDGYAQGKKGPRQGGVEVHFRHHGAIRCIAICVVDHDRSLGVNRRSRDEDIQ